MKGLSSQWQQTARERGKCNCYKKIRGQNNRSRAVSHSDLCTPGGT